MNINDPKSNKIPPKDPSKTSEEKENLQNQATKDSFEERIRDNLRDARNSDEAFRSTKNERFDFNEYSKEQIITYILLILGVLFLFIQPLLGGFLIGMVAGYYFTDDIIYYLRHIGSILNGHDHLRYVTLTGLLVSLFITAPGIFVGAAIVAALKQVIQGSSHTDSSS